MQRNKLWVPVVVSVAAVGAAAAGVAVARHRKDDLKEFAVQQLVEGPASNLTYAQLGANLERGWLALSARLERTADTPDARATVRHIIGIERWGQARLRVALGQAAFVRDEHHVYKPPKDASLQELRETMSQTRSGTVALARALQANPPEAGTSVEHNGLGPLTPKGWLRYLNGHADLESRRLRLH
ncbi:hypothetical protein [Deinococcus maricopensis]|uniref:DinB-like domain-containing protein n=1 Tax=Deinococcus maricopensis (strain DSM 21211 / LMG 22137 / NRRL B-23946 / LB-34) TaxID=709986 RepID=E8U5L7_DEIML|nr:hypothetical protein [Deinococcus maricopensis]ADV66356.1 hypothetical protein Deima_0700 [Deinococcus maricopensis DSM 21211]